MAPAAFGVAMQYIGNTSTMKLKYGAIIIFGWNFIGLFLEYWSIKYLYNKNPDLSITNIERSAYMDGNNIKSSIPESKKKSNFIKLKEGWSLYIQSGMLAASISYCMLYTSVLDGGSLVTAYLRMNDIPYVVLGVAKGIGACMGMIGTIITPCLHNQCGLSMESIGVITIWLFWICLFPSILAFDDESVLSDINILQTISNKFGFNQSYIILGCMIIARIGLWGFDLSENQMMQEKVAIKVRAQINGVQVSMTQLFYILIAILAMIFHNTDQFYILVLFTIINILCACMLYTIWRIIPACQMDRFDTSYHQFSSIASAPDNALPKQSLVTNPDNVVQ